MYPVYPEFFSFREDYQGNEDSQGNIDHLTIDRNGGECCVLKEVRAEK